MIDPKLLQILRCPIEGNPLEVADSELLERVRLAIEQGTARDRLDQLIQQDIDGGLVNQSGTWMYPIRGAIPTLVADEAIRLEIKEH